MCLSSRISGAQQEARDNVSLSTYVCVVSPLDCLQSLRRPSDCFLFDFPFFPLNLIFLLSPFLWNDAVPLPGLQLCSDGCSSLCHQQTTVEEQSRIMQLEEELTLRRVDIQNLQAQLGGGGDSSSQQPGDGDAPAGSDAAQPEAAVLRQQLLSAGREHHKESSELKEKYQTELAASQQEVDSLKTGGQKQIQEISELKQKVQQANKENMDMMDTWKVFCCERVKDVCFLLWPRKPEQ